jgi:hypothetical protein
MIGARDLERGVDRLGSRVGEEDRIDAVGQDIGQPLGSGDRIGISHLERGRIVEREKLPRDRVGDLLAAVPGVDAPEPRDRIEYLAAGGVAIEDSFGFSEDSGRRGESAVRGEGHP